MARETSGKLDVPIWEKYAMTVNEVIIPRLRPTPAAVQCSLTALQPI